MHGVRQCPPGFELVRDSRSIWCVNPNWHKRLLGDGAPKWLDLNEEARARCVKEADGRRIFFCTFGEDSSVYVKQFERSRGIRGWARRLLAGSPARREQAAIARAERENIPAVRSVALGVDRSSGREFLILQAVQDASKLTEAWQLANHGGLPGGHKDAVELIKVAAELFAYSHEQGFMHRDAHAGNIMIRRQAGGRIEAIFLDLQGARFSRFPVSMKAAARSLAQLNQWAKRHTTRAQRQRFVRYYLRRRLHVPPAYVGLPGERRLAREVERAGVVHAAWLARTRDRRLHREGKYFARIRLPDGWIARVTLALERRELFGDDGAPDRSVEDWRAALGALTPGLQNEWVGDVHAHRIVADHWLTKIVWTIWGSPCRKAFVRCHQLRHRDLPASLVLGFAERRGPGGLIDSAILLLPQHIAARVDTRISEPLEDKQTKPVVHQH